MKKYILALLLISAIAIVGCSEKPEINSYEDCVAAGNPIMESYPPQCRADGKLFVQGRGEVYDIGDTEASLTYEEAREIAEESECVEESQLLEDYFYNDNTQTYWIELTLDKPGCNPACVVSAVTKEAKINWRCMGLLE
jgi:hypothetical protein